jgi:hypothetical protein
VKKQFQHSKTSIDWEKIRTWLIPLGTVISVIITSIFTFYSIYHQAQLEEANRRQEHEKWATEFLAQIQLAKTNRQEDFRVWQEQLTLIHTNWLFERNIEWTKQQEIWRQQRSEEWTQQSLSLQGEQKKSALVEKEVLYQDFVFHLNKTISLINSLAWSKWWLCCYAEAEITMPPKSSASDIHEARESLKDETTRLENKVDKIQIELDDEKVIISRLMLSVKLKYSETIALPIDIGLDELNHLQVGIPSNPEVDSAIHKAFQNNTNSWYDLSDYYRQNLHKYSKSERLEKIWKTVDEMLHREIELERRGIQVKPEYLTNYGPFDLGNGMLLVFKTNNPESFRFDLPIDTNQLDQVDIDKTKNAK